MDEENDLFFDWLEAYLLIKKIFCNKCSKICISEQKIICIERYLIITENWEIAFHKRLKDRLKREKNNH